MFLYCITQIPKPTKIYISPQKNLWVPWQHTMSKNKKPRSKQLIMVTQIWYPQINLPGLLADLPQERKPINFGQMLFQDIKFCARWCYRQAIAVLIAEAIGKPFVSYATHVIVDNKTIHIHHHSKGPGHFSTIRIWSTNWNTNKHFDYLV